MTANRQKIGGRFYAVAVILALVLGLGMGAGRGWDFMTEEQGGLAGLKKLYYGPIAVNAGNDASDQGQRRLNTLADMTDTAGLAFLGLTVGCARCHDHKFDPFSQKEFYQLYAYFNSIPEKGRAVKNGNSPCWPIS